MASVVLLLLVGCRSHGVADAAVMETPAARSVASSVAGGASVALEEAEAVAYARSMMAQLAPAISFRLSGVDVYNRAYAMANLLLREGGAVSFSICTRGNEVTLTPTYADNEIMYYAYRHPSEKSRLTSEQKRALSLAQSVVKRVCSRHSTDYDRALALHDYLVLNSTYVSEMHGQDSVNAASRLLLSGRGVCDAYTRAYRLMLSIAGIENIFVAGEAQNDNHCWNLVRLQGHWVHVDCTYSDPKPDEKGRVYHTHFALPDSLLAEDHNWDRSRYPAATTASLYYPYRFAAFNTIEELVIWCRQHKMEFGNQYVTAYVSEIRGHVNNRHAAQRLFEEAHANLGVHVVVAFALEEHLPGVIVCRCNVND